MPRMELTAAVLSVRVAKQLKRELSLNVERDILDRQSSGVEIHQE